MKAILEVKNLFVNFKVQKQILSAVRGVSFSIGQKEILGIVGESGCGKTALAKAIVHFLPKDATETLGHAFYKGQDLFSLSSHAMERIRGKEIGMIFQDPMTSLNPTMRIGNQIAEGYLHHNRWIKHPQAREYVIRLLKLVGIADPSTRIDDYPHMLSGGMRQRVMIALALAPKPKLIIADEPTTSLDVTIQAQILDLMREIKDQTETSFILITHDMSVVAGYCDRVLVMYSGKIVEEADVDSIFRKPKHPYTQGLLKSIPRLDLPDNHPLHPIPGSPPNLIQSIKGCAFSNRCPFAMSICKEKDPTLQPIDASHAVACWRSNETLS